MISCLENYFTLRNVGTTTPKSGRYLNELAGISTDQLDLIKETDESISLEQAWDDIERRAVRRFESQLFTWGSKYFRNDSYMENVVTGQYDNNTSVPAGTSLRGWKFGDFLTTHKNMSLVIQSADLFNNTSSDVTSSIFVYNSSNGKLLDTISATFTANKITTVHLNKEYPLWKYPDLFVCYDDSAVTSLKSGNLGIGAVTNSAQGAISNSATVLEANIGGVGTTGQGLILTYSIQCSWDNYVCQRVKIFEEPFLYLLGAEFCNERIFSDRINQYTLLSVEDALRLKDFFNDTYKELIDSTLKSMPIDFGAVDACFMCDREINYRQMIP